MGKHHRPFGEKRSIRTGGGTVGQEAILHGRTLARIVAAKLAAAYLKYRYPAALLSIKSSVNSSNCNLVAGRCYWAEMSFQRVPFQKPDRGFPLGPCGPTATQAAADRQLTLQSMR